MIIKKLKWRKLTDDESSIFTLLSLIPYSVVFSIMIDSVIPFVILFFISMICIKPTIPYYEKYKVKKIK